MLVLQYVWSTIPLVVKLVEQSSGLQPILVIRSTVPPGTTKKWEAEVRAKTTKPFQVRRAACSRKACRVYRTTVEDPLLWLFCIL